MAWPATSFSVHMVSAMRSSSSWVPLPRFNADASFILYRAQGDDGGPAVAVRARADGSEQLFLPGNNPAWAPDGQWIVYETGVLTATETGPAWLPRREKPLISPENSSSF